MLSENKKKVYNMKQQKGFTLIELMAVVAIIGILATISLPVFNHYIEKSKAAAGLASLGTFKNDVAVCFMHEDTFSVCNDGEEGIHSGTSGINWVESVMVRQGVIEAYLTASNHFEGQENVLVHLVPSANPEDAAMNWTVLCSDYNASAGTHLIDTCTGLTEQPE
jgi:prepilin-type N-terminal cleavage/methylation domain-containing protein